jgi:transcriptional regulator with XRE-family HTH domain
MTGFTQRLMAAISRRGLSNIRLAHAAGVSPQTLWCWRNGTHAPRRKAAYRLAAALDVTAAWLMTGDHCHPDWPAAPTFDSITDAYCKSLSELWGIPADRIKVAIAVGGRPSAVPPFSRP